MTGSAQSEQRIASKRAPVFLSHEGAERLLERVFCHVAYLVRLEPEVRHVPVRGLEDDEERRSNHPGRARDCDGGRCIGLGRLAAAWLDALACRAKFLRT
jgi:hypothetical protein